MEAIEASLFTSFGSWNILEHETAVIETEVNELIMFCALQSSFDLRINFCAKLSA